MSLLSSRMKASKPPKSLIPKSWTLKKQIQQIGETVERIPMKSAAVLCSMAIMAGYSVSPRQRRSVYFDYASRDEKDRIEAQDEKRRSQRKAARNSRKRNRR